jgi:hypothetical protein
MGVPFISFFRISFFFLAISTAARKNSTNCAVCGISERRNSVENLCGKSQEFRQADANFGIFFPQTFSTNCALSKIRTSLMSSQRIPKKYRGIFF